MFFINNNIKAQLFTQNFSSSTTVTSYTAAVPNNGQFDAIGTSGAGVVLSINTTGSNKLRFARTGNAGSYSRTTDFSPTPTSLYYKFDLTVSGNSTAQTTAAVFQVGSGYGTTNSAESNANTHSRFGVNWTATGGQFSLRDLGLSTNSANYSGTQTIHWFINNSGATITYIAPDGTCKTVGDDKYDLWIGTTQEFDEASAITTTQILTDLKFAFTAGTGTIDIDNILIDPITSATAPATPAVPTSNSPQCGNVTLTETGSAPAGVTWYWQGTTASGTGTASNASSTYSSSSSGTYYLNAQDNTSGCWSADASIAVVVNTNASITAQPSTSTSTICSGSALSALSVTATGSGLTYQWYKNSSASNSGGTLLAGATSATYTPSNALIGTTYYYCIVTGTCNTVTSNVSGAITVNQTPAAPATPTAAANPACSGTTLAAITGTPAGVVYFWQGTNASGTATTDTTNIVYNVSSSGTYYANAQQTSTGCWSTSSSIAVTVNTPPVISTSPNDVSQCAGGNATFSTTATGTSLTYQWQVSTGGAFSNLSNGSGYSNVTTASMTFTGTTAGMNGYQYQCVVSGASPCASATSAAATLTISSTAPTTAASALTTSNIGCNTFNLSCTKGNGSNRLIVVKAGSAPTAPTTGTAYTANASFGSGSTTAAGSYVVYNGTGNSVSVYGLSATTTYYYAIYEFTGCGSSYLLTGTIPGGNVTTLNCAVPIGILGINIDACAGSCGFEGNNELIWGYTGSYGWNIANNSVVMTYGSTSPPSSSPTYINTFNANATNTTTMNTAVGACGTTTFYDAVTQGFLPPNSHFVIANNCYCSPSAYNFTNLCGQGPVYVLYGNNVNEPCGGSGGIFGNHSSSGGPRYIDFNFSAFIPSLSTPSEYSYNSNTISSGDGAYVTYAIAGGAPTSYGTGACTIPIIILPVEIKNFTGEEKQNSIQLNWSTSTERNVNYFSIEKSMNGIDFFNLGTVQAFNNELGGDYRFTDNSPVSGINYYRLKTTDNNSEEVYYSTIEVNYNLNASNLLVYQNNSLIQIISPKSITNGTIEFYTITGQLIKSMRISTTENQVFTISGNEFNTGLYFIRLVDGHSSTIKKVFIE